MNAWGQTWPHLAATPTNREPVRGRGDSGERHGAMAMQEETMTNVVYEFKGNIAVNTVAHPAR